MSTFLSLLPSLIGILGSVAGMFSSTATGYVSAHPTLALVLGGLYSIFAHLMPSPVSSTPTPPPAA